MNKLEKKMNEKKTEVKAGKMSDDFVGLIDNIFGSPLKEEDEREATKAVLMFMLMERLDRIAEALENQ